MQRQRFEAAISQSDNWMAPTRFRGGLFRASLGETTVTAAAVQLGVNRVTLNSIVNNASGSSADMAYRVASAFGTSAELWTCIQVHYDVHHAGKVKRPHIESMVA